MCHKTYSDMCYSSKWPAPTRCISGTYIHLCPWHYILSRLSMQKLWTCIKRSHKINRFELFFHFRNTRKGFIVTSDKFKTLLVNPRLVDYQNFFKAMLKFQDSVNLEWENPPFMFDLYCLGYCKIFRRKIMCPQNMFKP